MSAITPEQILLNKINSLETELIRKGLGIRNSQGYFIPNDLRHPKYIQLRNIQTEYNTIFG